jgi:hypothetical protein
MASGGRDKILKVKIKGMKPYTDDEWNNFRGNWLKWKEQDCPNCFKHIDECECVCRFCGESSRCICAIGSKATGG